MRARGFFGFDDEIGNAHHQGLLMWQQAGRVGSGKWGGDEVEGGAHGKQCPSLIKKPIRLSMGRPIKALGSVLLMEAIRV